MCVLRPLGVVELRSNWLGLKVHRNPLAYHLGPWSANFSQNLFMVDSDDSSLLEHECGFADPFEIQQLNSDMAIAPIVAIDPSTADNAMLLADESVDEDIGFASDFEDHSASAAGNALTPPVLHLPRPMRHMRHTRNSHFWDRASRNLGITARLTRLQCLRWIQWWGCGRLTPRTMLCWPRWRRNPARSLLSQTRNVVLPSSTFSSIVPTMMFHEDHFHGRDLLARCSESPLTRMRQQGTKTATRRQPSPNIHLPVHSQVAISSAKRSCSLPVKRRGSCSSTTRNQTKLRK